MLRVVNCLVEGVSVRATERLTGVHRDTILRILQVVGDGCGKLLNEHIRRVHAKCVQVDEIWTYVFKKQGHLDDDDDAKMGDQYVFVAIDADTKLAISHLVGKRSAESAFNLMRDLQARVVNRFQLTTDGFQPYLNAVEDNFGADIDYATLVKMYSNDRHETASPAWYGPAKVTCAMPQPIMGQPAWEHISTSYIERRNLTMRMQRFTRLTNAFSKKLDNLKAQIALHFAHYNWCRVHRTLRVTPAMEAGLATHVWSPTELLGERHTG
ncbi:MAG: IS1 family transposase [Candidatus Micrarchaeaceae archaeon]